MAHAAAKTAAAGLPPSRCHETPLKAPREFEDDGATSLEAARRRYFDIFFFFFGLVAMAYFLLNVMMFGRVEFKLRGRVSVPLPSPPLPKITMP
jgi:hypothetical protein